MEETLPIILMVSRVKLLSLSKSNEITPPEHGERYVALVNVQANLTIYYNLRSLD